MKSGIVALVGRANVGKSSLLNAMIGEKVAIVSPKPQTTRKRTVGILNEENLQIVFFDTPGVFKPRNKLDEFMQNDVKMSTKGVDIVLYVLAADKNFDLEIPQIEKYSKHNKVIVVVNKMDLVNYEEIFPKLSKLNSLNVEVVPVSARTRKNLNELKKIILNLLPEGPAYYSTEDFSDMPISQFAAEYVREAALYLLHDEVPHGIYTQTVKYSEKNDIDVIDIEIIVERDSHKQIVIGENGATLKKIGTMARRSIEEMVDKQVLLNLFVKVKKDWRNSSSALGSYDFKK